jgi:hypothetical protein
MESIKFVFQTIKSLWQIMKLAVRDCRTDTEICISYLSYKFSYRDSLARFSTSGFVHKLPLGPWLGCPRKKHTKFSVQTETSLNLICFGWFLVCLAKPTTNFFLFVLVFWNHFETTETNRSASKQTEKMKIRERKTLFSNVI